MIWTLAILLLHMPFCFSSQLVAVTVARATRHCQAKNWWLGIQILPGTNPSNGSPPYYFNLALAGKLSQSRPFVLVLLFFVARVCGYVDALEAVTTATQKEPFLMDADPTSHRVRLWQGGSASCPVVKVVPVFSLLIISSYRFIRSGFGFTVRFVCPVFIVQASPAPADMSECVSSIRQPPDEIPCDNGNLAESLVSRVRARGARSELLDGPQVSDTRTSLEHPRRSPL